MVLERGALLEVGAILEGILYVYVILQHPYLYIGFISKLALGIVNILHTPNRAPLTSFHTPDTENLITFI